MPATHSNVQGDRHVDNEIPFSAAAYPLRCKAQVTHFRMTYELMLRLCLSRIEHLRAKDRFP